MNRHYHATRIPIAGGLEPWVRLGAAVGLSREGLIGGRGALPGVRLACDAYVDWLRARPLLEAVAPSLTEVFEPAMMAQCVAAWEQHYPWVDRDALEGVQACTAKASRAGEEALAFVLDQARSRAEQAACVRAVIRKTELMWQLLDSVQHGPARNAATEQSA
jgi:pyrroloquinoline-quinone synthase